MYVRVFRSMWTSIQMEREKKIISSLCMEIFSIASCQKWPRIRLHFACVHFRSGLMQNGDNAPNLQCRLKILFIHAIQWNTHAKEYNFGHQKKKKEKKTLTAHSESVQVLYDWSSHQTKDVEKETNRWASAHQKPIRVDSKQWTGE